MPSQRLQSDPAMGMRNQSLAGRGRGLPSTTKYRSGHLPSGVIPVSRAIPVKGGDIKSGSDMDTSSDSEIEAYGSVETSPQDDKYTNGKLGKLSGNHGRQAKRDAVMQPSFLDDEVSHMTMNSVRNPAASRSTSSSVSDDTSEAYYFNVDLQPKVKIAKQVSHGVRVQTYKLSNGEIPSAPLMTGSVLEVNQVPEQFGMEFNNHSTRSNAAGVSAPGNRNSLGDTTEEISEEPLRTAGVSSHSLPAKVPTFHASGLVSWSAFISYDACVRLCLHAWASQCPEAPLFLENECAVLRNAFGLKHVLLQPEEDLLKNRSSELVSESAGIKPKNTYGKIKVQVRKVKMGLEPPIGCSIVSFKPPMKKLQSLRGRLSSMKSTLSSEWEVYRKLRVPRHMPSNGSLSHQSLALVHVGTQYVKELPEFFRLGLTALRNHSASYEMVQETYSCSLRLKSSPEEETIKMQPGSGETRVFLPDGLGDALIVEVHDSKRKYCGRVVAQIAEIVDDPGDKLRWWSMYQEPDHILVGRVQLYINYSTSPDEMNHLKCGSVAETVAYDFVLETAMKAQNFQQRNLLLHGSWKWLVTEFATYYGVSDAYTRLRYLLYVMDVATPTADCLELVHDLLSPVVLRSKSKGSLSHQENRMLGDVSDQIEQILSLVFENYKSLDEASPSGIAEVFTSATRVAAPALVPALKLYKLLNDILLPEAQSKLCRYFQIAAKKRCKRHLAETEEFISNNNANNLLDPVAFSTAYQKMKSVCLNIKHEIFTDIEIHNQHILPSFLDLPNLSASIYSADLNTRLRAFLFACTPSGPQTSVTELVIATSDFQRDLASWNLKVIKAGVNAKELFHLYINLWIQEKRLALLELCKPDKVKWSSIQTQDSTSPFVDEIYDQLKETLKEYDVIISRWPEYTIQLESAMADVEKTVVETMEKQYADVLSPLKEHSMPIKLGIKYVQKISKGNQSAYSVSTELGIFLNSMKRVLDVLRPPLESQIKLWGSCIPDGGSVVAGEHMGEVTVMLRTKLRIFLQSITEKLVENTRLQTPTKLKKIIQDAKENVMESDIRSSMLPLKELIIKMIDQLHSVFDPQVFIILTRGFWDRMGQDVLKFLAEKKENRSWYKASRVAVSVLDETFASQMQQLLGNALQEKDLEPPRSILEVRSMLCKDSVNHKDSNYLY
ncbi:OLC1v1011265C1 [Oldenlandia corymbosa var. corymbosa]|uniref:OLC1v1011265C1 n=1 Tax=Oldenlandia corymbosa var. corymbosa TaxID=529605 RepID=A0AAV1DTW3_OLDCO|nr:OLC1v1011265C1 [Oldenlandia corymbosa var. corymbosa]